MVRRMYFTNYLVLILCFVSEIHANIVLIKEGAINGTTMVARNGKTFNAYLGIPYAKPPVGKLRLQAPQAFDSWNGIRDCVDEPPVCLQWSKTENGTIGSEDCLYINVYTPLNATKGDGLPVNFYIYGGIFKGGSNVKFGPEYIMERNVILVMPNYRGGALGFLSTGDTVISGNFALKDQLLALKWTRRNIESFGGDFNKVTLHGHSSGAVMGHMHLLSPLSRGYFQQIILQSGTAICPMSYYDMEVARSVTKIFAQLANCNSTETSEEMLQCFMELDADVFPLVGEHMYIIAEEPDGQFRPVIENRNVENAFLTEIPNKMKIHSTIPMLIGLTSGEGGIKTHEFLKDDGVITEQLDKGYKLYFPVTLQYAWHARHKFYDFLSVLLRTHYFGRKKIDFGTYQNITNIYTHGLFGACTMDMIRQHQGPKHVYLFDYPTNYSLQTFTKGNPPVYFGVSHADELPLIYYEETKAVTFSPLDTMVSEELVKRWVNFIESGDPNKPVEINETMISYWKPMVSDRIEYLRIRIHGTMETDLYKGIYEFWRRLPLYSKYYN